MKPKNRKERQSSFIKFLLLFLVTTGTVMGAVYFNYKVPSKENEILREQAKAIDEERIFQNNFFEEMQRIKSRIDSLDKDKGDIVFESTLINTDLGTLLSKIPTGQSTYSHEMQVEIVELYSAIVEYKGKLRELTDVDEEIKKYENELTKCKENVDKLKDALRRQ